MFHSMLHPDCNTTVATMQNSTSPICTARGVISSITYLSPRVIRAQRTGAADPRVAAKSFGVMIRYEVKDEIRTHLDRILPRNPRVPCISSIHPTLTTPYQSVVHSISPKAQKKPTFYLDSTATTTPHSASPPTH